MPKVEVTLSSYANISFNEKKVFEYDDGDWEEMHPEQRQEMINEDAEQFLNETVEWDYKVLS